MPSASASTSKPSSAAERIRAYIAGTPPASRKALRAIRATARAAAPEAVEGFGYGIPGMKLDGRPLVYYAGWSTFCSLYPITGNIKKAHAKELEKYETSKGTVRFPLEKPVPVGLVRKLVKARIAEVQALRKNRGL